MSIAREMKRKAKRKMVNAAMDIDSEKDAAIKQTVDDAVGRATIMCMTAFCLTVMFKFKEILKRDNRLNNLINITHEYIDKIHAHALNEDEENLMYEILDLIH